MNICIIIPSYNLSDKLKKCLNFILNTNYKKISIVIVDNGSQPSLEDLLNNYKKKLKNLFFLRNKTNVGFATSVNQGLNYSLNELKNIDYYLLLNNDAYLKKNFFTDSVDFLNNHHSDLMSTVVMLTKNRGVDSMGVDYYSDGIAINRTKKRKINYLLPGACLFIKSGFAQECFNKFGWFFIPIFESYNEDVELSLRALLMEKKILLLEKKLVLHDKGSTSIVDKIHFLGTRNQIWAVLTTWTFTMIKNNFLELIKTQVINNIIYFLKFKYLSLWQIYLQTIWNIPRLLRIRKKIQAELVITSPKNIFLKNPISLHNHIVRSKTYGTINGFIYKNKRTLYKVCFSILFTIFLITSLISSNNWWRFSTRGEIYFDPKIYKGDIYFGNNEGKFYSVEEKSGKENWNFRTGYEIVYAPVFYRNKVIFSSVNYLYALDLKKGKEVWRYPSDGMHKFTANLATNGTLVFAVDTNDTLYALNSDGKARWKFKSKPIKKTDDVVKAVQRDPHRKSFSIKNGVIYWGSLDGNLYTINIKDGRLKWKFNSKNTITSSILTIDGNVYFGNKDGTVFILKQSNGQAFNTIKNKGGGVECITLLKKNLPWEPYNLLITYEDGKIINKNQGGRKIWSFKKEKRNYFCPFEAFSTIILSYDKSRLITLDSKTGKTKWNIEFSHSISVKPIVKKSRLIPEIYISDEGGNIYNLVLHSGKNIWSYQTNDGIRSNPVITSNNIYVASTDGGLYRINKFSGKSDLPMFGKNDLITKQGIKKLGKNEVLEIDIIYDDSFFTNPWRDVSIQSDFIHESGKKIHIKGFYYDKDTWKVRFNPPVKGLWNWKLEFEFGGHIFRETGNFTSKTDTKKYFLRLSELNSKRLTLDGKNIFSGIGLQEAIFDNNKNGYPLDDWSIGNESEYIINLTQYLSTYGKGGGFNLYRFNLANASFDLWSPHDIRNEFLPLEGKWADTFLQSLKDNEFQVWMTIFGFNIPYSSSLYPIERRELTKYIEYIIARYGAYVSIWEIANEAILPDELARFLATIIKKNDFENRPVSVSWEKPHLDEINIISPHWYETEPISESDLLTVEQIDKFSQIRKPVVFGEQGNTLYNWDPTSATRMRVRTWTAFFNEGIFVFWNYSHKKRAFAEEFEYGNANQFIGEEERKYMKILQEFTNGIDLSAKKEFLKVTNLQVRGYKIISKEEEAGYFYHFNDQTELTTIDLEVYLPKNSEIEWLDPATGKILLKQTLDAGDNNLTSPVFYVDLAFKIKFID